MAATLAASTIISALVVPPLLMLLWVLTSTSPSSSTTASPTPGMIASFLSTFSTVLPNLSSSVPSALHIRGKRIVLLIAHPDDEAMFFGPTLTHLTAPELGNHVKVLCLSTGNAEKLGSIRKKELQQSALHLGVRRPADVFVIDDQDRFPDSMSKTWSATDIATLLAEAFAPALGKSKTAANGKREENKPPRATIDVLITFDKQGISSHPNHISLSHGAELFIRLLMRDKSGWRCPVSLYHLRSINISRKYSFLLDAPYTIFSGAFKAILSGSAKKSAVARGRIPTREVGAGAPAGDPVQDRNLIFIANPAEYWKIRDAMTSCHKSQMVWFRWGWISLGRYMVINELVAGT